MLFLYLLVVYEKDNEILRTYGYKTNILKTINEIMKNINPDISIKITVLNLGYKSV